MRFKAWRLVAALLLAASFNVPAVTITAPRLQTGIVWVDKSRVRQQKIETRESRIENPRQTATRILRETPHAAGTVLDQSLFQRPPPATS